jgi:excisionase family DNA binding protein
MSVLRHLVVFLVIKRDNCFMNNNDLLKTGDVGRMLGVSRQHVVDLCDRGEISFVRVGAHRRIPRSEISRLKGALSREQERSLWLHQALLGQLLVSPDEVLTKARHNLDRWRSVHRPDGMTRRYLDEWSEVLNSGVDAVVETLTSRTPESCELRQNSPFAGVLPDNTREQVLRSFNHHWSREHAAA